MGVKYKVNETFFDSWSQQMAYVLGFWFADGSVEFAPAMRGKYIRVACTDKSIIMTIRSLMRSEHTIVETDRGGHYKRFYLLRIGSSVLFDRLVALGVTERKSRTITLPMVPEQYFGDFIRGYFDGDGCVYLETGPSGNFKRLTTVFTSGSEQFLNQLHHRLCLCTGVSAKKKVATTKGQYSHAYQLRFSTRDSLRLHSFMYHAKYDPQLSLERKRGRFELYLQARNLTDRTTASVLSQSGPVIVN